MRRVQVATSDRYVAVSVDMLHDPLLSMKAKGLLCVLLTATEGQPLARLLDGCSSDGRGAIESGIEELAQRGYLTEVAGVLMVTGRAEVSISSTSARGSCKKSDKVGRPSQKEIRQNDPQDTSEIDTSAPAPKEGVYIGGVSTEVTLRGELPATHTHVDTHTSEDMSSAQLFPELEDKPKLMRESLVNTFDKMVIHFPDEEAAGINLRHYFDSIMDWSETGGAKNKPVKRTSRGWVATMRQWMRTDNSKGVLKRMPGQETDLSSYFKH